MSAIARFQSIDLDHLTIDRRYQRPLDDARVEKMVENFDPRKLGTLEVSLHNGKASVFDGQHRRAVLAKLGIGEAPCLVHEGLSPQEEADLFVALQTQRKRVRPTERFKAKVFAGDPEAKAIKRTVEKAGWHVGERGEKTIRAVRALERIYRKGRAEGLAETLEVLNVWEGDPRVTDGMIVEGLFWLIWDYGDRLDGAALRNLEAVSPVIILRRAVSGLTGGGGWTAAKLVAAELRKIAGVRGRPRGH